MVSNLSKLNDLINTANYTKAEFYLYDLLKEKPNDYNLNKNLGMVLLAQNKYQGALKSFEKCYFINNQDTDILLNLSFLFLKVQDHAQCIKFSEEAINTPWWESDKEFSYRVLNDFCNHKIGLSWMEEEQFSKLIKTAMEFVKEGL